MWDKEYTDYKKDKPLKKHQVEPSYGIIGCEMHEINGWGDTFIKVKTQDNLKLSSVRKKLTSPDQTQ